LVLIQIGKSQTQTRFDYYMGYGFYDGIHVGAEYFFKSKTQSVSLSVGGYFESSNNLRYYALTPSYNIAVFRKRKDKNELFKWHLNNKFVIWQQDDDVYRWRVISFIPTLNRQFILYDKCRLSIDAGPSLNVVLDSKRKTFEEVGWPYHVYPNFSIRLIF
jgi:hypothetical protein